MNHVSCIYAQQITLISSATPDAFRAIKGRGGRDCSNAMCRGLLSLAAGLVLTGFQAGCTHSILPDPKLIPSVATPSGRPVLAISPNDIRMELPVGGDGLASAIWLGFGRELVDSKPVNLFATENPLALHMDMEIKVHYEFNYVECGTLMFFAVITVGLVPIHIAEEWTLVCRVKVLAKDGTSLREYSIEQLAGTYMWALPLSLFTLYGISHFGYDRIWQDEMRKAAAHELWARIGDQVGKDYDVFAKARTNRQPN